VVALTESMPLTETNIDTTRKSDRKYMLLIILACSIIVSDRLLTGALRSDPFKPNDVF
jgi:hypothetical protein